MRAWSLVLLVACRSPPPTPTPVPPVTEAASADAAPPIDAAEVIDALATLPNKCAADSPADAPCTSYGGTYRISLRPRDGERCVLKKPAEARITIDGAATYRGIGDAAELAPLARAIGKPKSELRIGAGVEEGVCCIDLEVSPRGTNSRVRVRMARGATIVRAEANDRLMAGNDMCDSTIDVTVELE